MNADEQQLKIDWPKGCAPPTGYVAWHNWAAAQGAHGLKQKRCKRCARWHFPQEVATHTCVLRAKVETARANKRRARS